MVIIRAGAGSVQSTLWLTAGYHKFEYCHFQWQYGLSRYLYMVNGNRWEIVPDGISQSVMVSVV